MITISRPKIVPVAEGRSRLVADIIVGNDTYPLWYEVDSEYARYLCADRADAFLIALLRVALSRGENVRSEAPVTDTLLRKIRETFIPAVVNANRGKLRSITIEAATIPPFMRDTPGAIGTGMSCGVDSLYTYASHEQEVTYIVVNQCVCLGESVGDNVYFGKCVKAARRFAEERNLGLIVGRTNYDGGTVPGVSYSGAHFYGNAFAVYALQHLFARYYIACGHTYEHLSMQDFACRDCAEYELLLGYTFTTEGLNIVADGPVDRLEKIRVLSDYESAYRYLSPCCTGGGKRLGRTVDSARSVCVQSWRYWRSAARMDYCASLMFLMWILS